MNGEREREQRAFESKVDIEVWINVIKYKWDMRKQPYLLSLKFSFQNAKISFVQYGFLRHSNYITTILMRLNFTLNIYKYGYGVPLSQMVKMTKYYSILLFTIHRKTKMCWHNQFSSNNNNFIECLKWMVDGGCRKKNVKAACSSIFYFIWCDLHVLYFILQ